MTKDIEYRHGFTIERSGSVTILTLQATGKLNALDLRTKRGLTEELFQLNLDGITRCIVIRGADKHFCAGDDLSGGKGNPEEPYQGPEVPKYAREPAHTYRVVRSVTHQMVRSVLDSDVPVIAALQGYAIQSGLTLALACDLRVADRSVRLSSGTLRFAMLPDEGGHHLLVQTIGLPKAMQVVLMAKFLDAEEALEVGLIHEVVDDTVSVMERAMSMAEAIASGPATATRLAKRALRRAADSTLEQSFDFIALAAAVSDYDPDMSVGREVFARKSQPDFRRFGETILGDDLR